MLTWKPMCSTLLQLSAATDDVDKNGFPADVVSEVQSSLKMMQSGDSSRLFWLGVEHRTMAHLARYRREMMRLMMMYAAADSMMIITKIVAVTVAVVSAATAAVVIIPEVVVLRGAIGSSATMPTSHPRIDSEDVGVDNDGRLVAWLAMMIITMMTWMIDEGPLLLPLSFFSMSGLYPNCLLKDGYFYNLSLLFLTVIICLT